MSVGLGRFNPVVGLEGSGQLCRRRDGASATGCSDPHDVVAEAYSERLRGHLLRGVAERLMGLGVPPQTVQQQRQLPDHGDDGSFLRTLVAHSAIFKPQRRRSVFWPRELWSWWTVWIRRCCSIGSFAFVVQSFGRHPLVRGSEGRASGRVPLNGWTETVPDPPPSGLVEGKHRTLVASVATGPCRDSPPPSSLRSRGRTL